MPGAAILVVRAAQRAGAGRVTLGALDRELLAVVPGASPETVLCDLSRWDGGDGEHEIPGVPTSPAFHARIVGPGLGATPRTRAVVARSIQSGFAGPQVFDADALNVLAGEPERLVRCTGTSIVTPHAGEAAGLLGRPIPADDEGRARAAREIARRSGGVCVLKGASSVVTDGERVHVNDSGNPGMATAGAGDVLAGILGAYLAASIQSDGEYDVFDAVVAAVFVHGLAGDLAAAALGERAVVASDLVDYLPEAQLAFDAEADADAAR
jgi:NAD(P)H-hydrate epimerase